MSVLILKVIRYGSKVHTWLITRQKLSFVSTIITFKKKPLHAYNQSHGKTFEHDVALLLLRNLNQFNELDWNSTLKSEWAYSYIYIYIHTYIRLNIIIWSQNSVAHFKISIRRNSETFACVHFFFSILYFVFFSRIKF